jgi:hypothetical protein
MKCRNGWLWDEKKHSDGEKHSENEQSCSIFLYDNSCDYDRYQKDEGLAYEASDCNVGFYPGRVSSTILHAGNSILHVLKVFYTGTDKTVSTPRACTRVATRLVYAFYSFRVCVTTHS